MSYTVQFSQIHNAWVITHETSPTSQIVYKGDASPESNRIANSLLNDQTLITHVAVKYNNTIYSLPAPAHHHQIQTPPIKGSLTQGFLLIDGQFINRQQAAELATRTKQAKPINRLHSEDLW